MTKKQNSAREIFMQQIHEWFIQAEALALLQGLNLSMGKKPFTFTIDYEKCEGFQKMIAEESDTTSCT